MKKFLKLKLIFVFVVVTMLSAVVVVLGVSSSARASTAIRIQGAVSCDSQGFVGVWIQSSGGGSTFAAIYNSTPTDGLYQNTITTNLPTTISLHVGCGGSTSNWSSDNWTPGQTVNGPVTLTASCHEGNMSPHTAVRCSYGPTKVEAAAYNWANALYGTNQYSGECVAFVRNAYKAAGVDFAAYVKVPINNGTYPVNIWPNTWYGWTGNSQPPPYGALVFFLDGTSQIYSHVTFSKGDGTELSTSDAFNENSIHVESISEHDSRAYSKYVGWWLFA